MKCFRSSSCPAAGLSTRGDGGQLGWSQTSPSRMSVRLWEPTRGTETRITTTMTTSSLSRLRCILCAPPAPTRRTQTHPRKMRHPHPPGTRERTRHGICVGSRAPFHECGARLPRPSRSPLACAGTNAEERVGRQIFSELPVRTSLISPARRVRPCGAAAPEHAGGCLPAVARWQC